MLKAFPVALETVQAIAPAPTAMTSRKAPRSLTSRLLRIGMDLQFVAHPKDGVDVGRALGIGLDLETDILDVGVHGTLVAFEGVPLGQLEELEAREHPAGLAREDDEDVELGGGEVDGLFAAAHS